MDTYVAWIEMDRAKVVKIRAEGAEPKSLRRREIKHHTSRDPKNHKDSGKFFDTLARALKGAGEVLLIGPGLAKSREFFRKYDLFGKLPPDWTAEAAF